MKPMKQATFLLVSLVLLFVPAFAKPHSIFAKNHNQTEFSISEAATLAGVRLSPGDYRLKWEGEGEGAQITILKEDKVVATVVGSVLTQSNHVEGVSTYVNSAPDGSRLITRIELATKSLVFQPETAGNSEAR